MQIRTAGELRGFLTQCIVDIANGKMEPNVAHAVSKVAAQVNQSLAVEINTALQLEKMGQQAPVVGTMLVGANEETEVDAPQIEDKPVVLEQDVQRLVSHFQGKKWCEQCEDQVDYTEASGCKSRYCAMRPK